MPETTWPEGVIARYLTVGGATVDLTHRLNFLNPPEPFATAAACSGCPDSEEFSHWVGTGSEWDGTYKEVLDVSQAEERARDWAQSHAEKCRAMPRPDGA
ncbi:hypothetical protein J7E97_08045 [Streptomyces sp. ISL-66]|uniref:hypothetical protein n=1 Tax=Streptomyces sp. ISL-66 TaxID=2819186 RepID=UPI001BEA095B|nr:hypothetical protein [Streptomyces sp. ISL-66]MBT2467824.1 hypothetical protein [Streptomyces sp. ISL-66]